MIDTPPEPPAAQEEVIAAKLAECGLKAGGFTVRYEAELQGVEVLISPLAEATPAMFGCIHDATFPEFVRFEDLAAFRQFIAFQEELFRPQAMAEGEAELQKRGLWEGFPRREAHPDLPDLARALEVHAGFSPGTMLRAEAGIRIVIDPVDRNLWVQMDNERLAVLLVVLKFASARDRFSIGFIGNDKVRE